MNTWSIIATGFDKAEVTKRESIFSLGNGAMGMRANFEEEYTGDTLQGSYIGGVYYPDKTKVGWWKNGYPEYFAKVLNAPSWIGIKWTADGQPFDINTCPSVQDFRQELNMKEGWLQRSLVATLPNSAQVRVVATRFLSLRYPQVGAIRYEITPLSGNIALSVTSYVDSNVKNNDANWDELFWAPLRGYQNEHQGFVIAQTKKSAFRVCTFMENHLFLGGKEVEDKEQTHYQTSDSYAGYTYACPQLSQGQTLRIEKYGGYITSVDTPADTLKEKAQTLLKEVVALGFDTLLHYQKEDWAAIWHTSDIVIKGDEKAQQAIRFNIFQLNQTYSGKYAHLNIGPKGFTGEKYGGSTYWDTEAYCLPFYMATKGAEVARNLLLYRYHQLPQAIANAQKLGFTGGVALYPMVTMNGEECHNEWEITFEEIHRNGAIAFAIYNYTRYTADESYLAQYGWEVLVAIARFWAQRVNFSTEKQQYVLLGVTGPNEYENNVNNNFYTNYLAGWCLQYTAQQVTALKKPVEAEEVAQWEHIAQNLYLPYSAKDGVYLQQDGFFDKDLQPASAIPESERPLNQHWSWDRILRSPYIKQADTLQGFYFFEEHFSKDELQRHYEFYEPFTVHESSLSPCVHSVLASALGKTDEAYALYLRTARLDLDDYNKEVHEGLHITSMAGTWLSIVEGFAGMRVKNSALVFTPRLPQHWESLTFKVVFRGEVKTIHLTHER